MKTDSRQDAKNKKMGLNFDEIITEVGGRGKYQMIRYSVLGCIPIAMSWHLVGNTLITAAPAHTCVPPSFETPSDNHLIADYVSTYSPNQKPAFSDFSIFDFSLIFFQVVVYFFGESYSCRDTPHTV